MRDNAFGVSWLTCGKKGRNGDCVALARFDSFRITLGVRRKPGDAKKLQRKAANVSR
jgi:hypothetical protein